MRLCEMACLLALLVERPPDGLGPVEVFRLRWVGGGFQLQLNGGLYRVVYERGRFDVVAVSEGLAHRTEDSERLQAHLTGLPQAVEFIWANAPGEHLDVRQRAP